MLFALVVSACLSAQDKDANAAVRQYLSLDGAWEVVFDTQNRGRAAGWHQEELFVSRDDRREIRVPSCWEEIEEDYEGVAFYGRHFTVPRDWQGKTVRLQFDAVNYVAEVWLNDHVLGRHEGGYGPFEFRVDDLLEYDGERFNLPRTPAST
jgi:beta-galactosidase/beta-glucuronidase